MLKQSDDSKKDRVYTIGHSIQTADEFIRKLKMHGITCVCDVRSTPYSQYATDYNAEAIRKTLRENGIAYVYLGREFGARRTDRTLYDEDGRLNFERTAQSELFQAGVQRLQDGMEKGFTIALMCADKRPEDCHRCILVGHALSNLDFDVENILEDGSLESQSEVDQLLLDRYSSNIFQMTLDNMLEPVEANSKEDIEKAYRMRAKEIAYKLEEI